MGFSTPSYDLTDLIARIDRGDIQIPDFQRDYSWDEDKIRSLIVTVLRGYPMGALLALDTRNETMRFRPRPLGGAPDLGVAPGLLLLDGQQRLSTLYQCFSASGLINTVDFRGEAVQRSFYVDIATAVSEELLPDEAVFAVDAAGNLRSHFAPDLDGPLDGRDRAIAAACIPVAALLSPEGTDMLFEMHATGDSTLKSAVALFNNKVLRPLAGYRAPMIRLGRDTARAGVGSIFAQVNTAGIQLDVFDLLSAVFASEDPAFRLLEDWEDIHRTLSAHEALAGIGRTQFLSAVSLLVTAGSDHAGGQREDILSLTLAEYQHAAAILRHTFSEVARFLEAKCIFSVDQVPYTAQIIPLAVLLARLLPEGSISDLPSPAQDKLNQWFWCGVFGELYGAGAVKLRSARDVVEVYDWITGARSEEPQTVRDAHFAESRLLSAGEDSAIYHALWALLMARGARDWRSRKPFDHTTFAELEPGFYQIFPASWGRKNGIDPAVIDCVLNRTPMGKRTEVVIDGYSPAHYLRRIQSKSLMDDHDFDTVLASHELNVDLLHQADIAAFMRDRRERFVGMVEYAMNKPVVRDLD